MTHVKDRILPLFSLLIASILLTSCETTTSTGYGYFMGELNDDTILELFALTDEAANNLNYSEYKSFFGPNFVSVDRTKPGGQIYTYRTEYLDFVEGLFNRASYMNVNTHVMEIVYSENNEGANVKIQEEEKRVVYGNTEHYSSLIDVDVGFEDGWIFINKTVRTDQQIIEQ